MDVKGWMYCVKLVCMLQIFRYDARGSFYHAYRMLECLLRCYPAEVYEGLCSDGRLSKPLFSNIRSFIHKYMHMHACIYTITIASPSFIEILKLHKYIHKYLHTYIHTGERMSNLLGHIGFSPVCELTIMIIALTPIARSSQLYIHTTKNRSTLFMKYYAHIHMYIYKNTRTHIYSTYITSTHKSIHTKTAI